MQKNTTASTGYLLAFFLGGVGAHHFYYQNYVRAFSYLLMFWTGVPVVLGWIDMLFVKKWTARQNGHIQVTNTAKPFVENKTKQPTIPPKEISNVAPEPVHEHPIHATTKDENLEEENIKEEAEFKQTEPVTTSHEDDLIVEKETSNQPDHSDSNMITVPSSAVTPINTEGREESVAISTEPVSTKAKKAKKDRAMKKTTSFLKDTLVFYQAKDIILPEYEHLKTPKHIINDLNRIKLPKKTTSRHDNFVIEVSYGFNEEEFVKDSMRNAESRGPKTKEIPFQSYWPTFRNLDKPRLRWYLHWREQVLKGNYLEVDLSYIFLFVYELINYSFNRNAAFNVSMMVRLLNNYKDQHPKLANYMNEWLADMLYELEEDELAAPWSKKQTQTPKLYQILEEDSAELSSLPISIWKPYIRTKRETEFYASHKTKVNKKFKQTLPLIEKAYELEGATLLEKWFEVKKVRTIRHLYNSAVIGRNREPIHVYVTEIHPTEELKSVVHNLLRLSENVVRLESGEKRQIKVDEELLPEGLKEEMIQLSTRFKKVQEKSSTSKGSTIPAAPLKEESKKIEVEKATSVDPVIEFDWQEIEEKNKALRKLQAKIDDGEEGPSEQVNKTVVVSTTSVDSIPQLPEVPSLESLDDLLEDDTEDLAEFVSSMSPVEKEFVSRFKDGDMTEETAKNFAKENSEMLGFFLTKLNEKANQHLGDTLIEETDAGYEIIEDYEDVVLMVRSVGVEN